MHWTPFRAILATTTVATLIGLGAAPESVAFSVSKEAAQDAEFSALSQSLADSLNRIDQELLVESGSVASAKSRATERALPKGYSYSKASKADLDSYIGNLSAMKSRLDKGQSRVTLTGASVQVSDWHQVREEGNTTTYELSLHIVRQVAQLPAGQAWEEEVPATLKVDHSTKALVGIEVRSLEESLEESAAQADREFSLMGEAAQSPSGVVSSYAGGGHGSSLISSGTAGASSALFALSSSQKQAAANYALNWWNSKNSNYPTNYANDCTNFVSQAMQAGGWTQVTGLWNSNSAWWGRSWGPPYASYPWGGAENFYIFARNISGRATVLTNVYDLRVGDVLQYKQSGQSAMSHTMITTLYSGGMPYLTYHTTNTKNKPFSSLAGLNVTWYAHRT